MPRPWYQNKTDLEREEIIARRFCEYWQFPPGLVPVKRKVEGFGYEIDFDAVMIDGSVRLRFEAKYRDNDFGHYDTLFISKHKVDRAYELWLRAGKPVFFAAAFKCGTFAYGDLCYPAYREMKPGGRTDRNDRYDQELMVHIPLDQLKKF